MNAIDLLKQDHNFVETLFQKIESTPPSRHAATIKKIKDELDTHATVEEKVFYPALKAKGNKALEDITMEAFEEHAQVKKFLREIARSTSTEKREAKLKVLIEDVRHHVMEEEGEMFSLVEDQFSSEELEALGERIEVEKKKFRKAKGIPERRAEKQAGISLLDKAKEFMAGLTGGDSGQEKAQAGGRKSAGAKASAKSGGNRQKASAGAGKSNGSAKSAKASSGSGKSAKASSSSGKSANGSSASGSSGKASSAGKSSKASGSPAKASAGSSGGGKTASSGNGGGRSKKTSGGSSNGGGSKSSSAGAKSGDRSSASQKSGGGSRSRSSSK